MFNTRALFGAPVRSGSPREPWAEDGQAIPMPANPFVPQQPIAMPQTAPQAQPSPLDGWKAPNTLQRIIGGLGDGLSQWSGGQANFAQSQMMRRKAAVGQAQHDRDKADAYTNWERQKAWERSNPAPGEQPEIVRLAGIANDPTQPDYARRAAADRITALNDPVVSTPGGGMTTRSTVTGMMGGGAPKLPQPGAIEDGHRFKGGNPADPTNWEPVSANDAPAPIGNMGIPANAVSPGGSTPTFLSRADAAPFLKSLGPEGFRRWAALHNIQIGN